MFKLGSTYTVLILVALGITGAIGIGSYLYLKGRSDNEQANELQNRKSISGADKGELNYRSCHTGWVYDFGSEKCIKPR